MSLASAIAATYQTIGFVVRANGQQVPDVLEVSVSAGFDQINANAQLTCGQRPSWAEEGAQVEVYAVLNGFQALIFKGELSNLSWSFFPGSIVFDARDVLSRTRLPWGGADRVYTNQDDAAVIRNLLEAMGIPSSQANIESSSWTLGIVQEVILANGESPYSLIERIDSLSGYRTFSLSSGIIVRRRVDGRASFSPAYSYSEGTNILSIRRTRGLDGIVNKALVTGLTYEGLEVTGTASAPNVSIPNPPGTISESIQDDLIETDLKANAVAQRIVADKNRRPDGFVLDVSLNPTLQPGMTIEITAPSVEASAARVLIANVRHSIGAGGATTTITTTGGAVTGYAAGYPPIASFTVDLFRESLDTGGTAAPTPIIVGIADGSGSYDPDGTISGYSWAGTVHGGSINPPSGSTPVYRFVAYGGTSVGVTLVVTDNDGLTGTLTRDPLGFDASSIRYEALYTAEDTIVAYSGDGQATWNQGTIAGGNATCLAPFAPSWGEVWGVSDGRVLASLDGLRTSPQALGTLPAGVSAVWVHEQDSTRLWAGLSDGKVYAGVFAQAGTVGSATWSLVGTVPGGSIGEIRESYSTLGELWATSGTAVYRSQDGGASWSVVDGATGTAWRMAAGWGRNAGAWLSSSAVRYAEGSNPTFSPAVTSVRGVSVGWRQPELYAADGSSSSVLYLDEGFSGTATPAGTAPTSVNHMIRSGNEDRVVYLAGGNGGGTIGGVLKWIPNVLAPSYIRRTGSRSVRMVGYGVPVVPAASGVELIVPPWGGSGISDTIWYFRPAVGWLGLTPPVAGAYWRGIAASPLNPDLWLLTGNSTPNATDLVASGGYVKMADGTHSPLWLSTDAGQTWQAVTLPSDRPNFLLSSMPAAWRDDAADSWILGGRPYTAGVSTDGSLWYGGLSGSATRISGVSNGDASFFTPGRLGDTVVWSEPVGSGGHRFGYIPSGSTSFSEIVNTGKQLSSLGSIDRVLSSRAIVGCFVGEALWTSSDYRSAAITAQGSDSFIWVTSSVYGIYATGNGIEAVSSTGVGTQVVAPGAYATGFVRADRQSRRIVAARLIDGSGLQGSNIAYTLNGTTWQTLALPATAVNLWYALEVINRG